MSEVREALPETIDVAGVVCKRQWMGSWIGHVGQYTYSATYTGDAWEVGVLDRERAVALARARSLAECERKITAQIMGELTQAKRLYVTWLGGKRRDVEVDVEQEFTRTMGYDET